jgi:hypothetical protein
MAVGMGRSLVALSIVVAGVVGAGAYLLRPPVVPAVDFVDNLTGPTSAYFDIPFDKYTLTPEGLLRVQSHSRRANGIDRPVVRTKSDRYLSRDFIFEVDVRIPADVEDLVFVGFGLARPAPPYNEPNGVFGFRIHHLADNRDVQLAAIAYPRPGNDPAIRFHDVIGTVPPSGTLTVRLQRTGDRISGSILGQDDSERTLRIGSFPAVLEDERGFLYLSNTAEGTTFSNVRVRPRT